jgi:hypothetical protein
MAEIIDFLPYLERKSVKSSVLKYEIFFDEYEEMWKATESGNMWVSDSYEELMALLGWHEIDAEEDESEDLNYYDV